MLQKESPEGPAVRQTGHLERLRDQAHVVAMALSEVKAARLAVAKVEALELFQVGEEAA